jgi:chromosome-anchoring protein RacA
LNTSEVAKLLGVSNSTIKRWVKELGLSMERNDRGHYLFKQEDIEYLRFIQEQIQNGILLHEVIIPEKKPRKGLITTQVSEMADLKLATKIKELERKLDDKADSVTSYQLLQHRRELEDLQSQILSLSKKVESLELQLSKSKDNPQNEVAFLFDHPKAKKEKKKSRNLISSLFGF